MFRQTSNRGDHNWEEKMNMLEIKEYVDQLFRANHKEGLADVPIIGGLYVPTEDDIRPLKKQLRAALAAREWFYENGPSDAQPLPLGYVEREALKRGGVLHVLAYYARSLECRGYDVLEHPTFDDYARGVMASDETPDFIKEEKLLKRFPPRPLDGLGSGLIWKPPKEHARRMESWRRSREREDRVRAANAARDARGTICHS
jgi:hypothetical protein